MFTHHQARKHTITLENELMEGNVQRRESARRLIFLGSQLSTLPILSRLLYSYNLKNNRSFCFSSVLGEYLSFFVKFP